MTPAECDLEVLALYVAGTALRPADQDRIEGHLARCADCRREAAELGDVAALLAELPPESHSAGAPPDGDLLLQRILRSVRAQEARTRPRPTRAWMFAGAVA